MERVSFWKFLQRDWALAIGDIIKGAVQAFKDIRRGMQIQEQDAKARTPQPARLIAAPESRSLGTAARKPFTPAPAEAFARPKPEFPPPAQKTEAAPKAEAAVPEFPSGDKKAGGGRMLQLSEARIQTILLLLIVVLLAYATLKPSYGAARFIPNADDPYMALDTRTGMTCKTVLDSAFYARPEGTQQFERSIPFCSDLPK